MIGDLPGGILVIAAKRVAHRDQDEVADLGRIDLCHRRPSADGQPAMGNVVPILVAFMHRLQGDPPGNICEWVYARTDGNDTLAELADWLISRPLQILLILIAAWLLTKLARRGTLFHSPTQWRSCAELRAT